MGWAGGDASPAARADDDLRRVRLRLGSVPQLAVLALGDRVAGPGFLWFVTLTNVLLGGTLAAASARALSDGDGAWAAGVVAGAAWVALGVVFGRLHLGHPGPADGARVRVGDVDGRPAVVLTFSPAPLGLHAWGTTAVATALVAAAVAARGSGAAVPLALLAGVVVACVPDLWVRVRRGGHLALTPDGVQVRGGDGDAALAWDDVVAVRIVDEGRHATLAVTGRAGASSWRRRAGLLPRLAGTGATDELVVPLPLVDVRPSVLAAALGTWARYPGTRAELGDDRGRRRVAGTGLPQPG